MTTLDASALMAELQALVQARTAEDGPTSPVPAASPPPVPPAPPATPNPFALPLDVWPTDPAVIAQRRALLRSIVERTRRRWDHSRWTPPRAVGYEARATRGFVPRATPLPKRMHGRPRSVVPRTARPVATLVLAPPEFARRRRGLGLGGRALAARAGVALSCVTEYESGRVRPGRAAGVSAEMAARLNDALTSFQEEAAAGTFGQAVCVGCGTSFSLAAVSPERQRVTTPPLYCTPTCRHRARERRALARRAQEVGA